MITKISKTHSRLAAISVSFDAGARSEGSTYNPGISHMLEHCIFKGTNTRNWETINREVAFLGGNMNAFTSHEMVQYYISSPVESIEKCTEILSDMVFNSIVPEEEFLKEKEVVKEEEISTGDSTHNYIWNNFAKEFFTNYLANPVIGTQESISRFSRDEVLRFHGEFCNRENAVVSFSSNMSKADSKKLLSRYFGSSSGKISRKKYEKNVPKLFNQKQMNITKPGIEHTYATLGFPMPESLNKKNPVNYVMNTILSGGMDSRLFTEVREKRGLVYSINSYSMNNNGGGVFLASFSTRDKNVEDALSVTTEELLRMASELVTDEELQRAKNKMRSSFYAANESSLSLAGWGADECLDEGPTLDQFFDMLNRVTVEEVMDCASGIFDLNKMLAVICRKE